MERRTFLGTTTTVATFGLAGCLGDDDETQDEYDEAIDLLVENVAHLEDMREDRIERDEGEIQTLSDRLDDATGALDSARDGADDDMLASIDQAEDVASFQEIQVDGEELGLELDQKLEEAGTASAQAQYEQAITLYDECLDILADQRTVFQDLETAFEDLETDEIDAEELAYDGTVFDHVGIDDVTEFDASEAWVEGVREYEVMLLEVQEGSLALESENYEEARTAFERGRSALEDSATQFEEVTTTQAAPEDFRAQADQFKELAIEQQDAFQYWIDATHEYEAGNIAEGDSLIDEGDLIFAQAQQ